MSPEVQLLVLLPAPPGALSHGTSLRAYHLLRRLDDRYRITVAHLAPPGPLNYPAIVDVPWPSHALGDLSPVPAARFARWRRTALLGSPYSYSALVLERLQLLTRRQSFDLVLAYHPMTLPYALDLRGLPVIADLVDEPTIALWRQLSLTRSPGESLRLLKRMAEWVHFERTYCPKARCCLLASEAEVGRLRRLVPNASVEHLLNGVDLDHFRPTGMKPEPLRLLFTGNFLSRPNVEAVRHFHRRIFPAIARHRPDVRWELAGANSGAVERVVADDPRVEVSGALADLRPAFERAAVVVSPLVSGGGIKNKVLEAWAMGKAVVATPLGAAGLWIRDDENLLLARTSTGFAARTLELLEQPRRAEQLGRAGRATARERYTWDLQAAKLTELLDRVVARTDRSVECRSE